ncbi:hypothetical protein GOBAR_AA09767 [Gossypium barbadense]|uniref:Uncharacterized protein n=1 Tax=Gossypium barbadense TaxID=3634 RepID=A0A2P5Y5N9_GOSBA|nr:hypothetical protein GOBAR_AA09767 [Gossypium barbadense]
MAQQGSSWCECELSTVGGPGTCSIFCRAVPYFIRPLVFVLGEQKRFLSGRSKPNVLMEEFCNILEELKLTDIKPCNGWFTWTNNREGDQLVKERLDRFVASDVILDKFPFLAFYVVRQSRYDTCWAGEQELQDLISSIWEKEESNILAKMDMTRLEKEINRLMDGQTDDRTACLPKQARGKLGHLYDVEEKYWALRARSQWLREGDRNTRYFHVRALGRRRKNKISRLKDEQGNWHDNEEEICGIAWNYFHSLFTTSINLGDASDF